MTEACEILVQALPSINGLGLLVIAGFGSYVAYQQHRTSRARLKLDLFEKRFAVFDRARKFLTVVTQNGAAELDAQLDAIFEYRASIGEASFLFTPDTVEYLESIYQHALKLHTAQRTMNELPVGDERSRLPAKLSSERQWLADQLPELKSVFAPYLSFSTWT